MWKTDRKFLHCFAGKSHLKVKGASFEKEVSAGCLARAKGLEMQNSEYFRRNDGSLWEGRSLPSSLPPFLSLSIPVSPLCLFPITFAASLLRITGNVQRRAALIESYPELSCFQRDLPSLPLPPLCSNNRLKPDVFRFIPISLGLRTRKLVRGMRMRNGNRLKRNRLEWSRNIFDLVFNEGDYSISFRWSRAKIIIWYYH